MAAVKNLAVTVLASIIGVHVTAQTSWVEIGSQSLNRRLAPIVWDQQSDIAWTFGGLGGYSLGDATTRRLGPDGWIDVPTAVAPAARTQHSMVYDSVRQRIVLFGGYQYASTGGNQTFGDTWEFDGTNWTQVATVGPTPRWRAAMAFDAARGVTVLYGGTLTGESSLADTWEWDGVAWTQRFPAGAPPNGLDGATAAFDPTSNRVVLYGGLEWSSTPWVTVSHFSNEVWQYDGTTWSNVSISSSTVPAPAEAAMTWDPVVGAMRVVNRAHEHWLLQAGGVWVPQPATPTSINLDVASIQYAGPTFGTVAANDWEIWRFDGASWELIPATSPRGRIGAAMSTDLQRQQVVLYGGSTTAGYAMDTWEWDGANWTERVVATTPGPRTYHSLTYHSASDRSVLIGGNGTSDTWLWDGTSWTDANPTTEPSGLVFHAAADDPLRGRLVLFMDATWEWDGMNWQQVVTSTQPQPRRSMGMAFDASRGIVVMYGGYVGTSWTDETWEYDGTDWTLSTASLAPTLVVPKLVWDDARQRLVLLGLSSNLTAYTYEWIGGSWVQRVVTPASGPDGPLAWDPVSARSIVFSGLLQQRVMYSYGPDSPATAVEFGSGCPGSTGDVLALRARNLPWLGDIFELEVENAAPSAVAALAFGFSNTQWGGATLPFDLGVLGAPGCSAWNSVDIVELPLASPPVGQTQMPTDPSTVGAQLFVQGFAFDAANPLGLVTANSIAITVGSR